MGRLRRSERLIMTETRYRASLDFLTILITGPSTVQVDTDVFQVCFSRDIHLPAAPIWYNTTNNGDGTITILEGPGSPAVITTLTPGCWHIMVRVVDSPSIPIFYSGDIYILS